MTIYSARAIPATSAPRSIDPADYPACLAWWRFYDSPITNATVLTDTTGNITDLTVSESGTGDADASAATLTTQESAGNEVYAQTVALPNLALGSKHLLIELDIAPSISALTDGTGIIELGDPYNSGKKGWSVQLVDATGSLQIVARDSANTGTVSSTLGSSPSLVSARSKVLLVWDRTTYTITYYVGGVSQGSFQLSGDPSGNDVPATGTLKVGLRTSGTREANCIYYNVRLWAVTTIPSDISTIATDMALNSNEFPPGMLGVT